MDKLPENLKYIGIIMSNFDHDIVNGAEEKLKPGDVWGEYTAWYFWAAVWWNGKKFKAMIKKYCEHVDTLESDSLQGIMDEACKRYGGE